ncbi:MULTISPECIES: helix-turn-helix domain-containing protein [unclassified Pseudomonas]|jgi:predicted XRE-type DNA-binding protein|uniref:helix-turn-helix domain-containing protein n=1 Tax=unclassified Pseudomonas TaxID=196821 RepID=UPI0008E50F54|nr:MULTISPECIES: XRE family transcriptional regulator [unclassified Pseudomonas]PMV23960.1 XRE family transcriptional regulator [Pseudomonas sp. FW305-3-2-15-C-TSA2]PMV30626.1 XRE family transcriptional regulator [Pseudomonas sp. DP16D-L5]PMV40832.1 XRE family transcriptional regulator [Pseudomonas sp. FW305-3-2-15-A-LB2]PMV47693.1 XRE family transcriptional regulator [Pseudomonas sp. FW305-3-2-15-C-R2A1]PMV53113.1 XRE family transcriptional regulator [Pseudomonas sp. FW305-3-2-15-C-LB1]
MTNQKDYGERFSCVWDALEDTPQQAANMRLRSKLLLELCQTIRRWELSQKDAAQRLGISQPRLNDVLTGKIDKLSLDALVNLSAAAQMNVDICFNGLPA